MVSTQAALVEQSLTSLQTFHPQPRRSAALLQSLVPASSTSMTTADRKLILVLPAHESSPELCKVVASAVALGYPAPVIINWQEDPSAEGQSHLKKVSGMVDFLQWTMGSNVDEAERLGDQDLVLMMDAHDVWLQLPPDVLLRRYLEINEQANADIKAEHGLVDNNMMQQTILVSAQKGCIAPRNIMSDLNCQSVPESTLPDDVYGFFTDSRFSRIEYQRPRYLNSGSFLGPAGDMLRYFKRVEERMNQHLAAVDSWRDLDGDQGLFAEIFGEQEVWRRKVARQGLVSMEITEEVALLAWSHYEYHIGLDYAQQFSYPTCHSERGGAFVSLDDEELIVAESLRAGVDPVRVNGLPEDIAQANAPFADLASSESQELGWGQVPLFADFWTTTVPVAIHHNAYKKGLKGRMKTWWDRTWFFPHLRELIASRTRAGPEQPLLSMAQRHGIWHVEAYKSTTSLAPSWIFGTNGETGKWALRGADWGHICPSKNATAETELPWYDEVFRDGRGAI